MVTQSYDAFNRQEKPQVTLCNPNKDELYSLKSASEFVVKMRYNATSEIELSIPKEVDGVEIPAFAYVSQKRLLKVEDDDIGYFVISDVSTDDSGVTPIKHVRGLSLEFSMMAKKLSAFGGTMALYDVLSPSTSLLGMILEYIPAWSVGTIDSTLLTKFRTFDVADTNIYNFLMTDVSEAFGCIFTFDTVNNEISATAIDNVSNPTDVYLSHRNLIKDSEFKEIADELTTALYVYGGGDLDIRTVNPLGTNVIYNFSYYQTTDWMTQDLIDAIDAWEALILANQATYASTLTSLKSSLSNLVVLEGALVDLNSEYIALEAIQVARIESTQSLGDINAQLAAKQVEIDSKQNEIDNENTTITTLRGNLEAINSTLSFESNFTAAQIAELSYFTFENTYQNENLVQLDSMDADDVQDLAQELYDQGVLVLARISQPRYEFSMDTASILALKEYETFISQLDLGSTVYVEKDDGSILSLVLLEMVFDYENPQKFSMTFSNRLRLDGDDYVFSDLFGQPVKTGTTVKFDKLKWSNWASTYKNDVTSFITSALDASTNNLINASNEEIKIYDNGLRGRSWDSGTETYDSREVWLTSNMLAFTNDSWATAEMAVGEIDFGGTPLYGVVADAIVGRIIAGNTLTVENDANNFLLNEAGAFLNNASFTISANDGKSKIELNAEDGIRIQQNQGGTWRDTFYVDSSGNVRFTGDLTGASGTFAGAISASVGFIGGWTISSSGLSDSVGNYLNSNGDMRIGNLRVSGTTATFDGTIYADKLVGQIDTPQIATGAVTNNLIASGVSAAKITTGSMSGSRIYGGTISWPGVSMYTSSTGVHVISCSNNLILDTPGSVLYGDLSVSGSVGMTNNLTVAGSVEVGGYTGATSNVLVGPAYLNKRLKFYRGIFYGFDYVY